MIPVLMQFLRTYAVYITWPVAAVVGFVGYNIESFTRSGKRTDSWRDKSTIELRYERKLHEDEDAADPTLPSKPHNFRKPMFGSNEVPRS